MTLEKENRSKISVIVPVYNVERYLDQCVESIVKQSYQNLEIILVDDGSSDTSGAICDQWAARDTRIRVIHQENGGLSAARNSGLDRASGAYISFIDSDDAIEPGMLENLLNALEKEQGDVALCNFRYVFESETLGERQPNKYQADYQLHEEQVLSGREAMMLAVGSRHTVYEVMWNKLFRREQFRSLRFPPGKLHEDEFLFHQLIYSCEKVVCIPYVGYRYLQRENSIMGERSSASSRDAFEAYDLRCQFFLEREEAQLAVICEGNMLSAVKRLQKAVPRRERQVLQRSYWKTVWALYKKKWLPFSIVCKRFVRCFLL
ncbi:MAG: glycosyltransferase [Clostridiales bacterium]|nr:glycosyltransferase [Clostridiales bacterium]